MPDFLTTGTGRKIAYVHTPGVAPGVVFLGGFKSDMTGTKAIHLEQWAKSKGRAFLRFDYSGHGTSSEKFEDGTIGAWAEDAAAIIAAATEGPQILIGSSMGGWISLLLARDIPEKVAGLVGIAAAPDFTEDSMWAGFSDQQKKELSETGKVALPSDYGDPYIITKTLIEEGRQQLVLRDRMHLPFPARFLQGTDDRDVDMSVALEILSHCEGDDVELRLVKGADHRFSTPQCLRLIEQTVQEIIDVIDT